jgi:hypothetical protein
MFLDHTPVGHVEAALLQETGIGGMLKSQLKQPENAYLGGGN